LFSNIDSFQLVQKFKGIRFETNQILISLDVVFLFMNIPINLYIESIDKKWNFFMNKVNIPKEEFMCAVRLVLDLIYFCFDSCFYKQNYDIPMESSLAPITIDLVMRRNQSIGDYRLSYFIIMSTT